MGMYVCMYVVHAARHNDVKPLLGRELMILTHDDDDDDDMYVCMYVSPLAYIAGDRELTWLGGESRVNCSA